MEGFVTFASNVDVDSGRQGPLHNSESFFGAEEFQKNTSGFPKRPSVASVEQRIEAQELYQKLQADPDYEMSEAEMDIYDRVGLAYRDDNDPYIFARGDKDFAKKEDILILKAEDLIPSPKDYYYEEDQIGLWPEAILDNWSPIAIYVAEENNRRSRQ